jgi:FAD/FMN-containing dehydrogenase
MSGPPESFTGDWVTPDHPQYAEAVARWATNAERRAKAVAFVKSPQDVATVLRYATQSKLPIAVRGGGHSTSGASSIENGIVVDLSRYLSGARVDPVAKLAYVGGGAIWGTVDKAAIEHGLATVAGTVNHVSNLKLRNVQSVIDVRQREDWCWRVCTSSHALTSGCS